VVVETVTRATKRTVGSPDRQAFSALLDGPMRARIERRSDERCVAVVSACEDIDEALIASLIVTAVGEAGINQPTCVILRIGK
jgi:hypothetical protein